jgi:mitogen-activated protein kinase 7
MSAQDRETLAAAQARATQEADNTDSGIAGVAETAVHHRPIRDMEVDELERELSGMV